VIGSSLTIPLTATDKVDEDDKDDEDGDDDGDEDGPTRRARICCRSKLAGEQ
jgi:hypothetical protein